MASLAHCIFCFEVLSSNLERRKQPSLKETEALWDEYLSTTHTPHGQEEDEPLEDDDEDDESDAVRASRSPAVSADIYSPVPCRPHHERLAVPSPISGSSSSTPSLTSTASSSRTSDSAASASSSRSSVFSRFNFRKGASPATQSRVQQDYPVFVTWNTMVQDGSKSLRGCIGTFEAQELEQCLRTYALTSALEDTRFVPIDRSELPTLECGVTLLTDFETAPSPMAWELGKHGIRISFVWHGKRYGATYLPDVAKEQGWTKMETMISLMRKAGWSGRREEWQAVSNLNVVRYQGERITLSYTEWRAWRDWLDTKKS